MAVKHVGGLRPVATLHRGNLPSMQRLPLAIACEKGDCLVLPAPENQ